MTGKRLNTWYAKIAFLVVIVAVVAGSAWLLWPKPVIPANIQKQLTSTLLLPQGSQYPVNRGSVKFDPSLSLLSFKLTAFDMQISISEQPTPESFTDVPEVYQKVLGSMDNYYDFDTPTGTVYLTVPPQLNGKQTAVENAAGTLLFAKPSSNFGQSQWRQLFDSIAVVQ